MGDIWMGGHLAMPTVVGWGMYCLDVAEGEDDGST